jgi:photosystem II stability/assembly factor-like uncharacterized protein
MKKPHHSTALAFTSSKVRFLLLLFTLAIAACEKTVETIPTIRVTMVDSSTTGPLLAIAFNGSKGFVGGASGTFLKSEGGDVWTKVDLGLTGSSIYSIYFPSSKIGYLRTSTQLYITFDGGDNWSLQNDTTYFRCAAFPSENTGYMVGPEDTIYKTTDQGKTWSSQRRSGRDPCMYAVDTNTVFVADYNAHLYSTVNGGASWVVLEAPRYIRDIYFFDTFTGIAVTAEGIHRTVDGGISWEQVLSTTMTYGPIRGMYMSKTGFGCAVGQRSIFISHDSGASWEFRFKQDGMGLNEFMNDVYFIDDITGFAITESGNIYKFREEKLIE